MVVFPRFLTTRVSLARTFLGWPPVRRGQIGGRIPPGQTASHAMMRMSHASRIRSIALFGCGSRAAGPAPASSSPAVNAVAHDQAVVSAHAGAPSTSSSCAPLLLPGRGQPSTALPEPPRPARHPPRLRPVPLAVVIPRVVGTRSPSRVLPLRGADRRRSGGAHSEHWRRAAEAPGVGLPPAIAAQAGQQRGQNVPRWNMGRCMFSARPPHIRHGLVTAADWTH